MNGALADPWLASIVSFLPIVFFLAVLFFCIPRPLPTTEGVSNMPWASRSSRFSDATWLSKPSVRTPAGSRTARH